MKYLHIYTTDEYFDPEYNGSGYTEPWVSLTKEALIPSGNIVAFMDEEGYRFDFIGYSYNSTYGNFSENRTFFCTAFTSTITSAREESGVKHIVVDGRDYTFANGYYSERSTSSQLLINSWSNYDQERQTYFYVFTLPGQESQGDDVFADFSDERRVWSVSWYDDQLYIGAHVYLESYVKAVRLVKLIYESYTPGGEHVNYNKQNESFNVVIPENNQIYYTFDKNVEKGYWDSDAQEWRYRPMTDAEKLNAFVNFPNFESAHYDSSLKLYVAQFSQQVTEFVTRRHTNEDTQYVLEVYLPNSVALYDDHDGNGGCSLYYIKRLAIGSGLATISSARGRLVEKFYIGASTAPAVTANSFGDTNYCSNVLGIATIGNNVLYVPEGATGYDNQYWQNIALNPDLCDFHIENL